MKFSIIVAIYNVEKYINKCIKSIINQTYKNIEIILVNDGSSDTCGQICDDFQKQDDRIKVIHKINGGLSDARNKGIKMASGDYIILVDGDDYINKTFVETVKEIAEKDKHPDIIRISANIVVEHTYEKIDEIKSKDFSSLKPLAAINMILKMRYVEVAWLYVYKNNFWQNNKFKYPVGKIHEDLAQTPLILAVAQNVSSTSEILYNYVIRDNSITTNKDYEKTKKRVYDVLEHYDNHVKYFEAYMEGDNIKKLLLSFSAENLIYKGSELNDKDLLAFVNELKKRNIIVNIYARNLKKLIKKLIIKFNIIYYIKSVRKNID